MNRPHSLTVRFQSKVLKFPWRQKYSQAEFLALLANSFRIPHSDKILGLRDPSGNRFDLASWLRRPREGPPKLLDISLAEESSLTKALNKSRNSIKSNGSPSKQLREISKLRLPIGLIQSFAEFQSRFLVPANKSDFTIVLFFEDFGSTYNGLLKYHDAVLRNSQNIGFFYSIEETQYSDLKRPFFVALQGNSKFLEMRLNISEEDFEEMVLRVQRLEEDESQENGEDDAIIGDIEESRAVFLDFLRRLKERAEISEAQFYYLKCLNLENNVNLLHSIGNSLENHDFEEFASEIKDFLATYPQEGLLEENLTSSESQKVFNIEGEPQEQLDTEVYVLNEAESQDSAINIEESPESYLESAVAVLQARLPDTEERAMLISLIRGNDELVRFPVEIFRETKDEEDFLDTLLRLVRKSQKKEGKPAPQSGEKRASTSTANGERPPVHAREESRKTTDTSPKRKSFEFRGFLDTCSEKFSNEEFGILAGLFSSNDDELQAIIYQCQNIKNQEIVLKLFKTLAETKLIQFLIKSFESKEIQYIEKFKKAKNSPIFQAFSEFRKNPNLEDLKSSLLEVCFAQGLRKREPGPPRQAHFEGPPEKERVIQRKTSERTEPSEKSSENGSELDLNRLVNRAPRMSYASMALERKVQRSNSLKEQKFEMVLRRGTSIEELEKSKKQEPGESFKISVGQKEMNAGFEKIINDFYEKQHENRFVQIYQEMMDKCDFLDAGAKMRIDILFNHNDFALLAALSKFERKKTIGKLLRREIFNLLDKEVIHYELADSSPLMRAKIQKLNNMKHIMHELFNQKLITQKQLKLFNYLYLAEDITILSVYEVYLQTNDQTDLVENLMLINKNVFFQTRLDFDEIEQFDENIENQLSLLYAFKKHLTHNERVTMEKLIRAGDDWLTKRQQEKFSKSQFIIEIKAYASQKSKDLQQVERILKEQHKITHENHSQKYKDTISNFASQKFLKDANPDFLKKLVDGNHPIVGPIFEVFEMTKDKEDFLENLKLTSKVLYKGFFRKVVEKFTDKFKWTEEKVAKLKKAFDDQDKILLGAYEVYLMFMDESSELELADTANRFSKIK